MSEERKKIAELIAKATDICRGTACGECEYFGTPYPACEDALMVDFFIANGVRLGEKQAIKTSDEKQATSNQPDIPTTSGAIDIEKIEVE